MYRRLFNLPIESKDSFFIFGPRGTGKTAWLKNNLPEGEMVYLDLLDSLTFRQLSARPDSLREYIKPEFTGRVVIDETQKVPATYTYDDPAGYLATYVDTYLREEVLQEGLTRNLVVW